MLSSIYGQGAGSSDSFLVGSFESAQAAARSNDSAVCVFSLSQIERVFESNIQACLNGTVHHRNMEYISGQQHEGKCPGYFSGGSASALYNTCDLGLKISGSQPVAVEPYQTFSQSVTAVHYAELEEADDAAVLVLGTARGRLMVVLISSVAGAKLLTSHQLDRTPVTKVKLFNNYILALQVLGNPI